MAAFEATARAFFEACETGLGWDTCQVYCTPGATFSCQADSQEGIRTLEGYTNWMKGLFTVMPDGVSEVTGWGVDTVRNVVIVSAVYSGTHTGQGGPVPAVGTHVDSDFAYIMHFDGDKIVHLTKIWNADWSLKALGWA